MHIPAFAIPVARAQAGGARTHPKVERMTGIHSLGARLSPGQYRALPRGNLLMNVAAMTRRCGAMAACPEGLKEKTKRPGSISGNRASARERAACVYTSP
jgi:hypothetical protein